MSLFSAPPPQILTQPARGIADRPITHNRAGRVKYKGTYWFAKLYQPDRQLVIPPGAPVTIVAIQGITLLVTPVASL